MSNVMYKHLHKITNVQETNIKHIHIFYMRAEAFRQNHIISYHTLGSSWAQDSNAHKISKMSLKEWFHWTRPCNVKYMD